jgi:hypothetical protein
MMFDMGKISPFFGGKEVIFKSTVILATGFTWNSGREMDSSLIEAYLLHVHGKLVFHFYPLENSQFYKQNLSFFFLFFFFFRSL